VVNYKAPSGFQYSYISFVWKWGDQVLERTILMREAIRDPVLLMVFDSSFKGHPVVKQITQKKEEEAKRAEALRKEQEAAKQKEAELKAAAASEKNNCLDEALATYRKWGKDSDVHRVQLKKVELFKEALKFEEGALILEDMKMFKEAGDLRKMAMEHKKSTMKVDIGTVDQSTHISDSVVMRSNIGGGAAPVGHFQICPYCGKDIKLPKPPKYCPWCRELLVVE
jgi:hypothetical protein